VSVSSAGPTYLVTLQTIRTNWATLLANETAAQLVSGPKPTYSLDGENYSWDQWRDAVIARIERLNQLINAAQPYCVVSRGRTF